jgi:hypothetical protein
MDQLVGIIKIQKTKIKLRILFTYIADVLESILYNSLDKS